LNRHDSPSVLAARCFSLSAVILPISCRWAFFCPQTKLTVYRWLFFVYSV